MELISLKAAKDRYALSVSTFRKLVREGMPHYRVARKILVDPAEFERWFQNFRRNSETTAGDLDELIERGLAMINAN